MRKVIIFLLLAVGFSLAQTYVITRPQDHYTVNVFNGSFTSPDTTTALTIKQWSGAITVYCDLDTAAAQTPADVTVNIQMYNDLTKEWYDYYDGNDEFTIPSANWNGTNIYFGLATTNAGKIPGDQMRLIFTCAGVSGTLRVDIGGQ